MKDPERLLHGAGTTAHERELLASWLTAEGEGPRRARERTLAMVGLASGAAAVTAAAGAGAAGSMAPKVAVVGVATAAKSLVIGLAALAAVATVTVATIFYLQRETPRAASMPPPAGSVAERPFVPATALANSSAAVDPVSPSASPPMPAPRSSSHPSPPVRPLRPGLAEQVAEIDRARAALAANDPSRAEALAAAYQARYPGGAFTQEAEVLRIEALALEGDVAAATRSGRRFLSAHPTTPHAARVRALIGER